jgi:hypothetical protein
LYGARSDKSFTEYTVRGVQCKAMQQSAKMEKWTAWGKCDAKIRETIGVEWET